MPTPTPNSADQFRLADWTVHPGLNQLQRDGETVVLQYKAMQVLLALANQAGEVVAKNDLLDTVWDHRFVVEGVLKRCVSDIRKALSDDPAAPTFIETIPRHGYRLIAPVTQGVPQKPNRPQGDVAPYQGLDTFGFAEAAIFFGRDRAVRDICDALRKKADTGLAFVLVLGMSGVGKSSVVRAGVLPRLLRGRDDRRAEFRHSDTPGDLFDGLAACLLRSAAIPSLYRPDFGQQELATLLRERSAEAAGLVLQALDNEDANARLLLVIDQLEEFFALSRVDTDERSRFLDIVHSLAGSGRVSVIATMRSDYYHRCSELPALLELKAGAGQYDLLPPTPAEIRQIIQGPADAAGLTFETDPATGQSVAEAIGDAAIVHPEALPLLEFTLDELYKRRNADNVMTFAAYRQLGGVEGCLGQRAEETYRSLPPATKSALPHVLEALVVASPEDEALFTAQPSLRDIVATDERSENLVDAMITARLFTTHLTHTGEDRVVRIAHEALIAYWDRARSWLADNARSIRLHQRVAASASRWDRETRHRDLLLPRGWQLNEAETLLDSNVQLSDVELAYLQTSRAQSTRTRYLRRGALASVAVLGAIAVSAMYFGEQNRKMAATESARAESEAHVAQRTIQLLGDMFELSDPGTRHSPTITPKELLDEGAARVESEFARQPLIQATLLQTIGNIYRKRSHYDEARAALDASLAMRTDGLGADHPLVADTLADLADVVHDLGDFDESLKLSEQALAIRTRHYGESHPLVAQSLYQVGWVLHPIGQRERAEDFVSRALAMQIKLLPEGHMDTANSHKALGLFLRSRGALAEAEPHLLKALEARRKTLGNGHPDVGMSLNHLAGLYMTIGDFEKALTYSEEALALNRRILGESHPDVALSLYNLAGVHFRLKQFEEAEPYARASVEVNVKALGAEHANVAITTGFLAYVLLEKGELHEAIALSDEARSNLVNAVPTSHWRLSWLDAIRGAALAGLGQFEEAEDILFGAYRVLADARGPMDSAVVRVRENLESLYTLETDADGYERVSARLDALEIAAK